MKLVVEIRYGWRRKAEAALIIACAFVAGWLWLGNAGAVVLGLWSRQFWPCPHGERLSIDPLGVRWARIRRWRIAYAEGLHVQAIFRGEISDHEYAAVCRLLKSEIKKT